MLIIIIALIYYGIKYSKIKKLKAKSFPDVDQLIFKKWRSYELESARWVLIMGVSASIWNITVFLARAANTSISPATISPLVQYSPYLILFSGLCISGVYGGKAKKLGAQYRLRV
jgi:hypothetical protein